MPLQGAEGSIGTHCHLFAFVTTSVTCLRELGLTGRGVELGVADGVLLGVALADGVADGVELAEADGVLLGVWPADGVLLGVALADGVALGVELGVAEAVELGV